MASAKRDLMDHQVQGRPTLLTPADVADCLGVEVDYVKRRLLRTGRLPHVRVGKVQRVAEADLLAFIEENHVADHSDGGSGVLENRRRLRAARRR